MDWKKNGLTGDEVTRMTKKKAHKLHNLICFAKWQRNISKDDRAGHVIFKEEMRNTFTELCQKTLQEETICESKI